MEKMEETAFTELINVRSLEQQKLEEDERMKEMLGKRDYGNLKRKYSNIDSQFITKNS